MIIKFSDGSSGFPECTSASSFDDFLSKVSIQYDIADISSIRVSYNDATIREMAVMDEILTDSRGSAVFNINVHVAGEDSSLDATPSGSFTSDSLNPSSSTTPKGRISEPSAKRPKFVLSTSFSTNRVGAGETDALQFANDCKEKLERKVKQHPQGPAILERVTKDRILMKSDFRTMMKLMVAFVCEDYDVACGPTLDSLKFDMAVGFVNLFPAYKDETTLFGCEAIYCRGPKSSGILQWRWKNTKRTRKLAGSIADNPPISTASSKVVQSPCLKRSFTFGIEDEKDDDDETETEDSEEVERHKSWLKFYCTEERRAEVIQRLKKTSHYRYRLVHQHENEDGTAITAGQILDEFPCFYVMADLIDKDFRLLLSDSGDKLSEEWPLIISKSIAYGKKLVDVDKNSAVSLNIKECLSNLLSEECSEDLTALRILLALLPPNNAAQKRGLKVSSKVAFKLLIDHQEFGVDVQRLLEDRAVQYSEKRSPYLLAVGPGTEIDSAFIIVDHRAIPTSTVLAKAFDDLFKVHFVFGLEYQPQLFNLMTFFQVSVYQIDIGGKVPPTVRLVRAALNNC